MNTRFVEVSMFVLSSISILMGVFSIGAIWAWYQLPTYTNPDVFPEAFLLVLLGLIYLCIGIFFKKLS